MSEIAVVDMSQSEQVTVQNVQVFELTEFRI